MKNSSLKKPCALSAWSNPRGAAAIILIFLFHTATLAQFYPRPVYPRTPVALDKNDPDLRAILTEIEKLKFESAVSLGGTIWTLLEVATCLIQMLCCPAFATP